MENKLEELENEHIMDLFRDSVKDYQMEKKDKIVKLHLNESDACILVFALIEYSKLLEPHGSTELQDQAKSLMVRVAKAHTLTKKTP